MPVFGHRGLQNYKYQSKLVIKVITSKPLLKTKLDKKGNALKNTIRRFSFCSPISADTSLESFAFHELVVVLKKVEK